MAGTSQLDFRELFTETLEAVQERLNNEADPTIDKRPGEFFYDVTNPLAREFVRLWDAMNTMLSVGFLPWAFGVYLDYKGQYEIGLKRKSATLAVGYVTFTGTRGITIPVGTEVSTEPHTADDPIYTFTTDISEEIGMEEPTTAPTLTAPSAGSISDTVRYKVSFVGRGGETMAGPESVDATVLAKSVQLSNIAVGPQGTTARKIWRQEGGAGTFSLLATIANNTDTTYLDDNATVPASATLEPVANTTDEVIVSVRAVAPGSGYNVAPGAVSVMSSALDATVTNVEAVVGGSDRESDVDYTGRLMAAIASPSGQGNKADYARWATEHEGVAGATIISQPDGPNTVTVVLWGPDNTEVPSELIDEVQATIEPNQNGDGSGLAPIGAIVTVTTVTPLPLTVEATLVIEAGHSLDGADGTTAIRQDITNNINEYLQSLPAGGDVVWAEVLASIVTTEGVADVSDLSLNGGAVGANVAISNTQVPELGAPSFTV